jgi:Thymidine kinase
MWAGKTTTLISEIEIYTLTGKKCVIVRSSVDTRTTNVQTHRDLVYKGAVLVLDNLRDPTELDTYDVIGFDEGHFFNIIRLSRLVNKLIDQNKIIFIAMLKSTYTREPFPFSELLYARASSIDLRKAVCEICKQHCALHTKRRNMENPDVFVGGSELYYPCCDKCW